MNTQPKPNYWAKYVIHYGALTGLIALGSVFPMIFSIGATVILMMFIPPLTGAGAQIIAWVCWGPFILDIGRRKAEREDALRQRRKKIAAQDAKELRERNSRPKVKTTKAKTVVSAVADDYDHEAELQAAFATGLAKGQGKATRAKSLAAGTSVKMGDLPTEPVVLPNGMHDDAF